MKLIRLRDGSVVDVDAKAQNSAVLEHYGDRAFVCESVSDDGYGRKILALPDLITACEEALFFLEKNEALPTRESVIEKLRKAISDAGRG